MSTLAGVAAGRAGQPRARDAQVGDRLGGHIVQGHIDGTGAGARRCARASAVARAAHRPRPRARAARRRQGLDRGRRRLAHRERGQRRPPTEQWFEVSLIPETLEATTLGGRAVGDRVNLETDILARHVQRLLRLARTPRAPRRIEIPLPSTKEARMSLSTIPEALDALRAGKPVIVADDENRENEGDVDPLRRSSPRPEWIAWTVRWSSGFICAPMPAEWADRLDLPPMVEVNEDARGTAYTVSVDAADRQSTGISASDRAHTLNVLADPGSTPTSVHPPGPHPAAARRRRRRARARRPHRGRRRAHAARRASSPSARSPRSSPRTAR